MNQFKLPHAHSKYDRNQLLEPRNDKSFLAMM